MNDISNTLFVQTLDHVTKSQAFEKEYQSYLKRYVLYYREHFQKTTLWKEDDFIMIGQSRLRPKETFDWDPPCFRSQWKSLMDQEEELSLQRITLMNMWMKYHAFSPLSLQNTKHIPLFYWLFTHCRLCWEEILQIHIDSMLEKELSWSCVLKCLQNRCWRSLCGYGTQMKRCLNRGMQSIQSSFLKKNLT